MRIQKVEKWKVGGVEFNSFEQARRAQEDKLGEILHTFRPKTLLGPGDYLFLLDFVIKNGRGIMILLDSILNSEEKPEDSE